MRRALMVCAMIGLFSWAIAGAFEFRTQGVAFLSDYSSQQFAAVSYAFDSVDGPFVGPWFHDESFAGFGAIVDSLLHLQSSLWGVPIVINTAHPLLQQPACSITADPSTIPFGGSTVVSWVSRSATNAELSGIGIVQTTGSYTLNRVTDTQALDLTVSGPGGHTDCDTEIQVGANVVASTSN